MALFSVTAVPERRYQSVVLATILTLVAVRLVFAGMTPLSFDESLYWLWSKHIVGGYLDHPPVNPILIRIGTMLFGNTEFGVRAMGVLLALPASWAIWRSGAILFNDDRVGATAALYFNLTIVMIAGSALATPDNALVISTTFLLFTLVKLVQTGRGEWWLAIGLAFGIGLLSKYTTVFFAVSILAWLLIVPGERKWLFTPWPWLSGLIAVAVFSPTLIWNAGHGWASYHYQFNRLVVHEWSLRYLGEFIVTQMGMATPPIFVLGCLGLAGMLKGEGGPQSSRVLVNAMVWPLVIYFTWHTFHGRVEGNWPEPIYVPFVIAAAVAADRIKWNATWAPVVSWSQRLAVPGRARHRGLPLSAGGVRRAAARPCRPDGARARRRLDRACGQDRRSAETDRRTDRTDDGLRHRRLAGILSAVASLRGADQRDHALRRPAAARSFAVCRQQHVCL